MSDLPRMSDEYVLDTPVVREFVAGVRAAITAADSPQAPCERMLTSRGGELYTTTIQFVGASSTRFGGAASMAAGAPVSAPSSRAGRGKETAHE